VDVALRCGGEFGGSLFENFFAAAADVDCCTEFEEALGHGLAEAGAAPGNKNALVGEKIVAKHEYPDSGPMAAKTKVQSLCEIASDTKSVVSVLEFRRNAGARGAA
jgi:hypothetical protein